MLAMTQQPENTYRIVAHGLKAGFAQERATALLAAMFKCPPAKVMPMLAGRDVVIKKAMNLADATKYQAALERCGCNARIDAEEAPAPAPAPAPDWKKEADAPSEFALTPFTPAELARVQEYAKQVLDILNEKFGGKAAYDARSVEFLSAELNARRHKYVGALAVKIANLYGAFLGTVLIRMHAQAQPIWVKTPEGVGIQFRKHGGRVLKIAFPITQVLKQIEHGDAFSILTFVQAQKEFLAADPKPKARPKARVLKSRVVPEKGRHGILHLDPGDDGQPFDLVIPHTACCNCGTKKELHVIQVPLSAPSLGRRGPALDTEFPFCVPCVPTAHRERPGLVKLALVYVAVLLAYLFGAVRPLNDAGTLGPDTGALLLCLFAALSAAAYYLMNRAPAPQTSPWQPVTLKTLKRGAGGVSRIGFHFSNPAYAKDFAKANRAEIKKGRLV
jgi:hypothetical protein